MVEGFHPEAELGAGDRILLAGQDDLLGFLGQVVGIVHFAELFEFLLGVFEGFLGAFEALLGGFLVALRRVLVK